MAPSILIKLASPASRSAADPANHPAMTMATRNFMPPSFDQSLPEETGGVNPSVLACRAAVRSERPLNTLFLGSRRAIPFLGLMPLYLGVAVLLTSAATTRNVPHLIWLTKIASGCTVFLS